MTQVPQVRNAVGMARVQSFLVLHLRHLGTWFSAPPRRSVMAPHLTGFRAFAFRPFPLPGTSALAAFATDAHRPFRAFGAVPSASAARTKPGPVAGPYSCRTYSASSARCRGLMR